MWRLDCGLSIWLLAILLLERFLVALILGIGTEDSVDWVGLVPLSRRVLLFSHIDYLKSSSVLLRTPIKFSSGNYLLFVNTNVMYI